ncbi:MAG: TlpA disulfide reductase family protein [Ruminiclostridium sp.]|nr:TlpA disulfide reductase family protein [Ruminiclostridium sp.]
MRTRTRKRKIVILTMIVVFALLLSSCNGTHTPGTETEKNATEKSTESTTTEASIESKPVETTLESKQTEKTSEKTYDFSEGSEAKDFEVELITSEKVKLTDYRGKVVLLNLWATWCGYCVKELPVLQQLHEEYGDDLVVFTVSCGEDKPKVKDFIDKNKYTFIVGLDKKLEMGYPVRTIPITFIINKEGIISDKLIGVVDKQYEYFKEEIEKAKE